MQETFQVNGLTVKIAHDELEEGPSRDADNALFIVAKHSQFYVPAPGQSRIPESAKEVFDTYKKSHWVFNLEAYIHSGVCLALSGEGNFPDRQWDVSQVGFVFVSKKEWRLNKTARKMALSLIETWNQYLSGDVWYWTVEDSTGKELEACGGCYGLDYAKKEASAAAKHYEAKP